MRIALIAAQGPLTAAAERQPAGPARLTCPRSGRQGHRVTLYTRRESANCAAHRHPRPRRVHRARRGRPGPAAVGRAGRQVHAGLRRVPVRALAGQAARCRARVLLDQRPGGASAQSAAPTSRCCRPSSRSAPRSAASLRNADISAAESSSRQSIGRTVAGVLASSADEADELARLAVPKAAIRVIPRGIDTDVFTPRGRQGRARQPAPADRVRPGRGRPGAGVGGPRARPSCLTPSWLSSAARTRGICRRTGPFRELAQLAAAAAGAQPDHLRRRGRADALPGRAAQVGRRHGQRIGVRAGLAPPRSRPWPAGRRSSCRLSARTSTRSSTALPACSSRREHPAMLAHRVRATAGQASTAAGLRHRGRRPSTVAVLHRPDRPGDARSLRAVPPCPVRRQPKPPRTSSPGPRLRLTCAKWRPRLGAGCRIARAAARVRPPPAPLAAG